MHTFVSIIIAQMKRFRSNIHRFMGNRRLLPWIDALACFIFFGASLDDYFRYQFYRKSWAERNRFLTFLRSKRLIRKYNSSDPRNLKMMNDKSLMNLHFQSFLHREWIDVDECTDAAFAQFVSRFHRIILKPKDGSGGRGIYLLSETALSKDFQKPHGYIAEELIIQHSTLSALNQTSVNTLRVMTFRGQMISCILKVGRGGAVVDNMCSDGLYGNVNLKYGITDSPFFDINLNQYVYHPSSGVRLLGIEIPQWDKLKPFVQEAAKTLPAIQYVGWDIAVLADGFAVIEANEAPGHDLSCQSTVQVGLFDRLRSIKKETKK